MVNKYQKELYQKEVLKLKSDASTLTKKNLPGCRGTILLAGSAEDKSGSGRRMLRVSWEPSEETRVVDTVEPHQVWVLGLLTQVSFQLTKNKL